MARLSVVERNELWDLYEAGESQRSISRRSGVPCDAVAATEPHPPGGSLRSRQCRICASSRAGSRVQLCSGSWYSRHSHLGTVHWF